MSIRVQEFSTSHNLRVGQVVKVYTPDRERVAMPSEYSIYTDLHKTTVVGKATIKINGTCNPFINVDGYKKGVVATLPEEYSGCAIISAKITEVYYKSVKVVPVEYIRADKPLVGFCDGDYTETLLAQKTDYPNIRRVKE